jgi:hypothetical protein
LQESQQRDYRAETELKPLFDSYKVIPGLEDVKGDQASQWYTRSVNDPSVGNPDRTLDYLFFADRVILVGGYIRQEDTLRVSDHLPVVGEFELP